MTNIRRDLIAAALPHVAFDGWGEAALFAGARDIGVDAAAARAQFPKGSVEMAAAFHLLGDAQMSDQIRSADLQHMRYSERVAEAVKIRLRQIPDKEIGRRSTTLFSMPQHAARGAELVWGTADSIWRVMGDTSDDINWYSKRAILSAVYGSCLLFWLGDVSADDRDTWDFVDRRIGNVMQFEKFKANIRSKPALAPLIEIPEALLGWVKAPKPKPDIGDL